MTDLDRCPYVVYPGDLVKVELRNEDAVLGLILTGLGDEDATSEQNLVLVLMSCDDQVASQHGFMGQVTFLWLSEIQSVVARRLT